MSERNLRESDDLVLPRVRRSENSLELAFLVSTAYNAYECNLGLRSAHELKPPGARIRAYAGDSLAFNFQAKGSRNFWKFIVSSLSISRA